MERKKQLAICAKKVVEISSMVHNEFYKQTNFTDIPKEWLDDIAECKSAHLLLDDCVDDIAELLSGFDTSKIQRLLPTVAEEIILEIEEDYNVLLVLNNRLFVPNNGLAPHFSNECFSEHLYMLELDFDNCYDDLILFLMLHEQHVDESDEQIVLHYIGNDELSDQFTLAHQQHFYAILTMKQHGAYMDIDTLTSELSTLKENSINAHVEMNRRFQDLNEIATMVSAIL